MVYVILGIIYGIGSTTLRDMNHNLWTCFFLTVNLSHETTIKLSVFRRWRFYQHVWIVVVSDKRQVGSRVSFLFEFHPVNGLIPIQTFNDSSKMPTKLAKNWRYTRHFWTLFWLNPGQCWSWDLTRKNRPEAWTLQSSRPFSKSHPTKELGFGITKKMKEHGETWRKEWRHNRWINDSYIRMHDFCAQNLLVWLDLIPVWLDVYP